MSVYLRRQFDDDVTSEVECCGVMPFLRTSFKPVYGDWFHAEVVCGECGKLLSAYVDEDIQLQGLLGYWIEGQTGRVN